MHAFKSPDNGVVCTRGMLEKVLSLSCLLQASFVKVSAVFVVVSCGGGSGSSFSVILSACNSCCLCS